ncbi:hypothetical protein, partial [Parathermosynechococcus lividus]
MLGCSFKVENGDFGEIALERELCLFVVYEKRRRNGVSCWKRKKTRRGYTMSNDNVIAFQPTETVAP